MKAEITPLPWRLAKEPSRFCDLPLSRELYSENGIGCWIAEIQVNLKAPESGEANAAYIVKACNAYPELVKALKLFVDNTRVITHYSGADGEATDLLGNARAILKQLGEL